MPDLHLEVVIVRLRTELHFLELDHLLALLGFVQLLLLFVLELAEVHDLADRRVRLRVHLDEVEVGFARDALGLRGRDDTELVALGADDSDLGNANALVGARSCRTRARTVETGSRDG
jgi:hypothetical protein